MSSYAYFFPLIPVGNETNQTRTRKFFPEFEFSIKKPTCRGHCPKSKPYSKPNKPLYKSSTHKYRKHFYSKSEQPYYKNPQRPTNLHSLNPNPNLT
jgi:hypothetical protein